MYDICDFTLIVKAFITNNFMIKELIVYKFIKIIYFHILNSTRYFKVVVREIVLKYKSCLDIVKLAYIQITRVLSLTLSP